MAERVIIKGTVSDQTTIVLDERIALPVGRVRITVEPLPTTSFRSGATVVELASAQGVQPVETLDDLWGDFWLADESVDDFIDTIYQWRRETIG